MARSRGHIKAGFIKKRRKAADRLPEFEALRDADPMPITDHPDNIRVLVAGGPGKHSCVIPSWGMTRSVTLPLEP